MIEQFRIDLPQADLDDLAERLARARLPKPAAGEPWESGVDYSYLSGLLQHWRDKFDWPAQERRLNEYEHLMVTVGAQEIHACVSRPTVSATRTLCRSF